MKDVLNHLEYTKVFLIITTGMIALTYLVHIIFSKWRIIKFIPGVLSIVVGIYGFITIDSRIIFLDDIQGLTIFTIGTAVGLIGIIVAFIIGVFNKDRVAKQNKIEKNTETN